MVETYKLIPTLLHGFQFDFDKPDREWKFWRGWFQRQTDVLVKASPYSP
jgi:hypothetical protein